MDQAFEDLRRGIDDAALRPRVIAARLPQRSSRAATLAVAGAWRAFVAVLQEAGTTCIARRGVLRRGCAGPAEAAEAHPAGRQQDAGA